MARSTLATVLWSIVAIIVLAGVTVVILSLIFR